MRPNFIPGMRMKGIGRRSKIPHTLKVARAWIRAQAKQKKDALEQLRKEKANRPFEE